ncbi:MAG: hypothetical protein RLZZ316_42 [Bacteroidota bacterium]|jgi:hypothetical protein
MNLIEFKQSFAAAHPFKNFSVCLKALWYDGKGQFEKAHSLVQDIDTPEAAWIHAYLHRKEGDTWNANYWYTHAIKPYPQISIEAEWEELVLYFIGLHNL